MKKRALIVAAAVFCGFAMLAANTPTSGTIISEQSVACGEKKSKKSSTSVLCQQYVVHAGTTEYQIRQPKPSDAAIIPANTPIQFTLSKDKMKFKANGKGYEFLVVGTSAITPGSPTAQ